MLVDCNDFDMGDFEDLMKNVNVGECRSHLFLHFTHHNFPELPDDLVRMDTGEAIQDPNTRRIKTDKYRDMVSRSPQHTLFVGGTYYCLLLFESTYLLRNLV